MGRGRCAPREGGELHAKPPPAPAEALKTAKGAPSWPKRTWEAIKAANMAEERSNPQKPQERFERTPKRPPR